ncbi:MAG: 3-isopropylmalate dehydrogenase [Methylococcaceae bacterium]|nr:3-isopropylmalate dehydrogenase [Methylococcaceae bacterium]MCI0732622.1 3-isopropylmalate dehydrogenase [Methylococcaceae bacterium]
MTYKIAVFPGDGIGPEIVREATKVLGCLTSISGIRLELESELIGGAAYEQCGEPLPASSLDLARSADAILLGAVGGPQWESLDYALRPERGLLGLRAELDLFSNLRPAVMHSQLVGASTLKPEVVEGLDILIVRELTGGIYFGRPRGIRVLENGEREGFNTLVYRESQIRRIAHSAFRIAMKRNRRVCSVDKANVLECTELWREVMTSTAREYPEIALSHMYVDNAAMQLVRAPKQFDVIVTTNMFGDILSDCAAMLTGSIGMLPSASLDASAKGMYEPIHGSAPDIAGRERANPLATILSAAMLLRYTLGENEAANLIERAVRDALDSGVRTPDIHSPGMLEVGTAQMGDAVVKAMRKIADSP